MEIAPGAGVAVAQPRVALGVLCEDMHGALAALSRPQQRGLGVQVIDDPADELRPGTDVAAVDMRLHDRDEDPGDVAERWARWLTQRRCDRVEQRINPEFRGSPAAVLRGLLRGLQLERPVLVVASAYPSAGCVCLGGEQVVHQRDGASAHIAVAAELGCSGPAAVVSLDALTAGRETALARSRDALERGARMLVFDATNDSHIETITDTVAVLEHEHPVVAVTSGSWLQFHPRLGQDGFVVVAAAGARELDRVQLTRVADVFGETARITTPSSVLAASDELLRESLALHRVVVLESSDRRDEDASAVADEIATAVRRLLDVSRQGRNPALGAVVSGGVSSGRIVRALEPDGLLPGNELEPLCPVVRTVGGPFPHLPVITKASGVGSPDTVVRLVRRITGT